MSEEQRSGMDKAKREEVLRVWNEDPNDAKDAPMMKEAQDKRYRILEPFPLVAALLVESLHVAGNPFRQVAELASPGSVAYEVNIQGEWLLTLYLRVGIEEETNLLVVTESSLKRRDAFEQATRAADFVLRYLAALVRRAREEDKKADDLLEAMPDVPSDLRPELIGGRQDATRSSAGKQKQWRNQEDARAVERLQAGDDPDVVKEEWLAKSRRRRLADPETRFRQLKSAAFSSKRSK